jgi:hypothetical protein
MGCSGADGALERRRACDVYWRSISPFHGIVSSGMLKNITAAAGRAGRAPGRTLRT